MKIRYDRIRETRNQLDITQKELSERSGVHLSVIKALETGRNTEKKNVQSLCAALELPVEEIWLDEFRDTRVMSIVNNKGGCGKTSVCGSLAYVLAEMGYRVLLIDADAQRNLTSSYGMPRGEKHFGRAIERDEDLLDGYIQPSQFPNIDFVIADVSMGTLDMLMFTKLHRENLVKQALSGVIEAGRYDFVLIDTNPNLSLLNFNIVNASDYVLIPVQMASFDVEGIGTVIDFIQGIQKFNKAVRILGIVVNRYDARTRSITGVAEKELVEAYGEWVLRPYIKVDVKIQNAQWENRPVFCFGESRVTREYRELAKEVLRKC